MQNSLLVILIQLIPELHKGIGKKPVSMTMSLLWKTKESILASVFTPKQ